MSRGLKTKTFNHENLQLLINHMKVNVLLNLGRRDFPDNPLEAGEHEVSEAFGQRLIALKLAEKIEVAAPPPKSGKRKAESSEPKAAAEGAADEPAAAEEIGLADPPAKPKRSRAAKAAASEETK